MRYSIAIITYAARFEDWLKPLLIEIKRQRPDIEVILGVNGEKEYFHPVYRAELLALLTEFPNTYPTLYPRFRSLSRLWNLAVQASTEENTLILSDDLTLEDGFFDEYEQALRSNSSFTINLSFSAVSINKQELIDVNWFDERLLGIGWEDGDFVRRYKKHFNIEEFPNLNTEWCKNIVNPDFYKVHSDKLSEYIHNETSEDRLIGQTKDQEFGRYSEFNRLQNLDKPKIQYPYEQFYLENKHKL